MISKNEPDFVDYMGNEKLFIEAVIKWTADGYTIQNKTLSKVLEVMHNIIQAKTEEKKNGRR